MGSPGILRGASRAELRGTEPAVAEETQGIGLSRCALGGWFVCLQGSLRLGPAAAGQGLANGSGERIGFPGLGHQGILKDLWGWAPQHRACGR